MQSPSMARPARAAKMGIDPRGSASKASSHATFAAASRRRWGGGLGSDRSRLGAYDALSSLATTASAIARA